MPEPKWIEIPCTLVKCFQLEEEPELIYVIPLEDHVCAVVHNDAFDLERGKCEILSKKQFSEKYKITFPLWQK
jgi:hypothetical protein